MTGRVQDKVVVVTGGARGQGAAEARALADDGAHVIVGDILDEAGRELANSYGPGSGSITYRHLDVTSSKDWQGLRQYIADTFGRVDGLVNNAGIPARDRLPNVDLASWHRSFNINVTGALLGMQAMVDLMKPGSSIVNISSIAGLQGHVAAPYTVSKWAIRGLSKVASLEFGPLGIRVNTVFPGLIDTELMSGASPAFRGTAIDETPLGRIGAAEDIAPLIVYLIADESSYVTGAEIVVDGGLTGHVSAKRIADAIAV
ncbi:SDR family NAD(P)-dependent oxidoreductase [Pseudarthrobacter oxydans]|uniref:SDR family NAD(P)-dependent oxidoreductase n=1 Tax=Pseudarthrobacter oxydans TaxID=1671 RepID=UPI00382C0A2E